MFGVLLENMFVIDASFSFVLLFYSLRKKLSCTLSAILQIENGDLREMKFLVEGVTGNIYRATWGDKHVAVTQFHNDNEFKQFLTVVEELWYVSARTDTWFCLLSNLVPTTVSFRTRIW